MNAWESFAQIKGQPDGPAKKFALIKKFGMALSQYAWRMDEAGFDAKKLSCQELEAKIALLLDTAAEKSGYPPKR